MGCTNNALSISPHKKNNLIIHLVPAWPCVKGWEGQSATLEAPPQSKVQKVITKVQVLTWQYVHLHKVVTAWSVPHPLLQVVSNLCVHVCVCCDGNSKVNNNSVNKLSKFTNPMPINKKSYLPVKMKVHLGLQGTHTTDKFPLGGGLL